MNDFKFDFLKNKFINYIFLFFCMTLNFSKLEISHLKLIDLLFEKTTPIINAGVEIYDIY